MEQCLRNWPPRNEPLGVAIAADPPSDDVLLELGRVVWAAVDLEYVAYWICRAVRPRSGWYDDIAIGTRIDEAIGDLAQRPDDELHARAHDWLERAKDALAVRNTLLHAVPTAFVPTPGAEPLSIAGPWLTHFPALRRNQDESERKPAVHTELTVESLGTIRRRIEAVTDGWGDLVGELFDRLPMSNGDASGDYGATVLRTAIRCDGERALRQPDPVF